MFLALVTVVLSAKTVATQCPENHFNDVVDTSESRWMMMSPHFQCITNCRAQSESKAKKPALLERVFYLKRKKIDCLAGKDKRNYHETLDKIYSRAKLQQFEDLPLFYYNPVFKGPKFEAEKFCARMQLNFGMEPVGLLEIFIKRFLKPKILNPMLWSSEMLYSNRTNSLDCQAIWMSPDKTLTKEVVNCKENLGFVCTLPWKWHNEVCSSRCAPQAVDYCISKITKTEAKMACFPTCANTTCLDEEEDRYGFRPSDGDLMELCDKTVFVSKSMSAHNYAQMYCCAKNMQALALETPMKRNCFINELQKLKIANGTSFWTSGSSDKCPNSFGWCGTGDKEFMSYETLGLENFQSTGGKECVSATLENSSLVLQPGNCTTRKRFICERTSSMLCKESICPALNCSRESTNWKHLMKIGFTGVAFFPGCNKIISYETPTLGKLTYYKTHKYMCARNCSILSIQTKKKLDCVLSSLLANKVPPGKYWVSAVSMGCPSVLRWCDKVSNPIIDVDKANFLNWKKGEPSQDPLKECTVVEYKLTPPHFTFSKSDCNAFYLTISEERYPAFP